MVHSVWWVTPQHIFTGRSDKAGSTDSIEPGVEGLTQSVKTPRVSEHINTWSGRNSGFLNEGLRQIVIDLWVKPPVISAIEPAYQLTGTSIDLARSSGALSDSDGQIVLLFHLDFFGRSVCNTLSATSAFWRRGGNSVIAVATAVVTVTGFPALVVALTRRILRLVGGGVLGELEAVADDLVGFLLILLSVLGNYGSTTFVGRGKTGGVGLHFLHPGPVIDLAIDKLSGICCAQLRRILEYLSATANLGVSGPGKANSLCISGLGESTVGFTLTGTVSSRTVGTVLVARSSEKVDHGGGLGSGTDGQELVIVGCRERSETA